MSQQPHENPDLGVQDTGNSTTTALGSSETFTGKGIKNTRHQDVMVSCQTDADGTLYFDFSVDGSNWSPFPVEGFSVEAGIHEFHTAVKGPRWFRVRLVNGTAAQTYLRLVTYFGVFRQGNAPLKQTISADADALVVRSIDPSLDLAFGRIGGMSEDSKFGGVIGMDAADPTRDCWDWASDDLSGALVKVFPSSAATLYIASDAAGDTSLDFMVDVILSDGSLSQVSVTTDASNGTTPVSLGVSGLDVNRCELVGDDQSHAGNIYVQQGTGFTSGVPNDATAVLAFIRAGYGQTQQTIYRVPLTKQCRPKRAEIGIARASGADGSAELRFWVKKAGQSWVVKRRWFAQTGEPPKPIVGIVLPAQSLFRVDIEEVSDLDTNITVEIIYDLVDE